LGHFELSTVSSYLEDYMTYDENPMFAELVLTEYHNIASPIVTAAFTGDISFTNFAFYPSQFIKNLGSIHTHFINFEPRWAHTSTRLVVLLPNSQFVL
jgi:hypothetical protein